MTIEELYRDITTIVPLKPVSVNNFRNALKEALNSYFLFVKNYFDTNNVSYACESIANITAGIRGIKEFVKDEYKGIHVSVKRINNFQKICRLSFMIFL